MRVLEQRLDESRRSRQHTQRGVATHRPVDAWIPHTSIMVDQCGEAYHRDDRWCCWYHRDNNIGIGNQLALDMRVVGPRWDGSMIPLPLSEDLEINRHCTNGTGSNAWIPNETPYHRNIDTARCEERCRVVGIV